MLLCNCAKQRVPPPPPKCVELTILLASYIKQLAFSDTIIALHFSRKSDLLALGGEAGAVHVVSTSNWLTIKEIKITSSSIQSMQFSRSDERLAVGCSDGVLTLLDPGDGWKIAGEIDASESSVLSIDWSSKHLAVGRADGTVSVHEGARVFSNFFLPEAEHNRGNVAIHSVAFGASGRFLGTY